MMCTACTEQDVKRVRVANRRAHNFSTITSVATWAETLLHPLHRQNITAVSSLARWGLKSHMYML